MSSITGYSSRQIPFYGLPHSKIVKDAPTVEDAITMADLDWNVSLQPVYQKLVHADGSHIYDEVSDRFFTMRDDTQDVLGVVGKNYATFQNSEAFAFADELLGFGVEFDAAGHYDSSRKVFLTAKLPQGITVEGTDDSLDLFLLFKTSHDGSAAITSMITPVRLACTNMMPLATKKMVSKWSVRHTASAKDKVAEAARTLRIVDAYKTEFEAIASQLLATDVNYEGFEALVKELVPVSAGAEKEPRAWAGLLDTWNTSPTVDRSSAWGAVNAVGEFYEWNRGGRGDVETRFSSNIDGQTAQLRNRAVQLLTR